MNPGDFATKHAAEIDRSRMYCRVGDGGPELKLVALAATCMAIVAPDRYVHRESTRTSRRGFMQGTTSVPLIARSMRRLEAEQLEDFLHRDLGTEFVEVDAWHGASLGMWSVFAGK